MLRFDLTEELYTRSVLGKYTVPPRSALIALLRARQLSPVLQEWAAPYPARITPAGSFAKGTSIVGSTDIDLFISLPCRMPGTLEEIYEGLGEYFKARGYIVREQNVSIGITHQGVSVDLTPGRRQPSSIHDHSIYRRKARTWTKTNVHTHNMLVRECGRVDEIRATKVWRDIHGLKFPSFYLELSVIDALLGCKGLRLSSNFRRVLEYLASDFVDARVLDPANSANVISDDLNGGEKVGIALAASLSLLHSSIRSVIW